MGRTLVLGDVHGAARALEQVLERSGFDPASDRLVALGDLCDGWPEVDRCLDLVCAIPDFTLVLGNHDEWTLAWMREDDAPGGWFEQGGDATVASYARRAGRKPPRSVEKARSARRAVPSEHVTLLEGAVPFLILEGDGERRLFTHAGWRPSRFPEEQTAYDLRLSRDLWTQAQVLQLLDPERAARPLTAFDEVYLGHTPTDWREPRPVMEIWNLDQGAGWDGVLTLMDVHTHEHWQSDPVPELYPGVAGRR